nr:hypothetical protein [Evansella caseinilytica]
MILPTQINRFVTNLIQSTPEPQPNQNQIKLANQLASMHIIDSPYTRLPPYDYEQLNKGMICEKCHSFLSPPAKLKRTLICQQCGHKESIESGILRSVDEFKLLFPDKKITTSTIYDWCKVIEYKKRISRTLSKNKKIKSSGKSTYFVDLIVDEKK